jgi:hypothetical protein
LSVARVRTFAFAMLCAAVACTALAEDPRPARWLDDSGLLAGGFGRVRFEARDGNELTALVYRARSFDAETGPLWFVMHGASRETERYIEAAAPAAERYGALALAIDFAADLYPRQSDYTLGVTTRGSADAKAFADGRWRRPDDYVYSELEHVFAAARGALGGRQPGYYVFGHSAGAQFTHRLLTFLPEAHVLGAVAANAGWYTLPVGGADARHAMPYGLRGSPLERERPRKLFAAPFSILLGERDTATAATDDLVRGTPEALAQGATRLERGRFYYATGREQAQAAGAPFRWRLAIAPRAGHDAAQVVGSAAFLLFEPGETPCVASSAADARAIAITEVLADPPDGAAGDANGDGVRDASDDEFVELVNRGTTPVCLAGFALGDAAKPERHVFPLGRALAPGAALVVFGGGVPTGAFAGAKVETAAFSGSLNLTNAGDVLTLRDATDRVVTQLSWGDCAARACAGEHVELREASFSPGLAREGSSW